MSADSLSTPNSPPNLRSAGRRTTTDISGLGPVSASSSARETVRKCWTIAWRRYATRWELSDELVVVDSASRDGADLAGRRALHRSGAALRPAGAVPRAQRRAARGHPPDRGIHRRRLPPAAGLDPRAAQRLRRPRGHLRSRPGAWPGRSTEGSAAARRACTTSSSRRAHRPVGAAGERRPRRQHGLPARDAGSHQRLRRRCSAPAAGCAAGEDKDAIWRLLAAGLHRPLRALRRASRTCSGAAGRQRCAWRTATARAGVRSPPRRGGPTGAAGERLLRRGIGSAGLGQAWRDLRAGYQTGVLVSGSWTAGVDRRRVARAPDAGARRALRVLAHPHTTLSATLPYAVAQPRSPAVRTAVVSAPNS